ncbi:hypothetical protein LIER_14991 [Lithospermum erythrorhizon]|uniref:Uncharacterized protein n=1 Tax=Lithospermum erythrorhizon TaxID=34254 RepID=A0AAV3Q4C4_LITER
MAWLIQRLTEQIVDNVMEQLKERLLHLRGEAPVVSSFVREDGEETYTHTPLARRTTSPGRVNRVFMRFRHLRRQRRLRRQT